MESTLRVSAMAVGKTPPKAETMVYWTVTVLFCLSAFLFAPSKG
jgi:hypothetical protein